jgi:hypothetical protein
MDTARHDFDRMTAGAAPEGWTVGVTGRGTPRWTVEPDPTAPSAPHVLKQSGSGTFPWCVLKGVWTKADSVTLFDDFAYGSAK